MSCDFLNKCRTCLGACDIYHQLFDYVDDNYKILEMLNDVVPQIDIKTSQYPTLVCQTCVDKLLTSYKFQQLCIETNNRLHDLLGVAVFESQSKLAKILDPLTSESSFKMEQEIKEVACCERKIQPDELQDSIELGNDCRLGEAGGSGSDSSNEQLSLLKEKSKKKSHLKKTNPEKPEKCNRINGNFPCSECGKVLTSLNRLKKHTAIHDRKRSYSCEYCNTRFVAEKAFKAHMLTHSGKDIVPKKYLKQNDSIENHDCREVLEGEDFIEEIEINITQNKNESLNYKDKKETLKFQCPDCPKSFKKKSSLSTHYKVHKKNDFVRNELPELHENHIQQQIPTLEMEKLPEIMVKEEFKLTPQIIKVPMLGTIDDNGEYFNNDNGDESKDCTKDELFEMPAAEESKNIDFVDTGIGEIEKPNKRNGNFPCKICGKIFDRPFRLKRHSSVHSMTKPHECGICKHRYTNAHNLKAHMLKHKKKMDNCNLNSQSRPEGFKCPDCPRRFEKQVSLSSHRQIHTRNASDANFSCMVCQRNFKSVSSLIEHIANKHPEVEKHKCDQCEKTFVLNAQLLEHLNRHKGNKNLVCLICEKEFRHTHTLKNHMRKHSGESPYLCQKCGKTFRSPGSLCQHMERHTGLKKFQCPECPSRFKCKADVIRHTKTHSNVKSHACDICDSRFTTPFSLQKHKLLHTGERPFKCDQCSMTFTISFRLRRHMRTHTGEKPYKCKYCERAYSESGDLTKHLRTHVGENTYMCDQCPKAFKYQAELKKHQSQHYKMAKKLQQQAEKMPQEIQQNEISEQAQEEQ